MPSGRENILEYARFHGLSRDHSLSYLDDADYFATIPKDLFLDLADPQNTPSVTSSTNFIEAEKIILDSTAAKLLKSAILIETSSTSDDSDYFDVRHCRSLKLELPLLKTDPEVDLKTYNGSKLDADFRYDKRMVPLDEERDEGLLWPSNAFSFPSRYSHMSKTERIEFPKESALWLQSALINQCDSQDLEVSYTEELTWKKSCIPAHATPPLLPHTPPTTSQESSPLVGNLQLLSDSTSPTKAEIDAIEKRLISEDELNLAAEGGTARRSEISKFLDNDEHQTTSLNSWTVPLSSSPLRSKALRLKVEVPLTPPTPASPAKHISWSEELEQIIPELARRHQSLETEADNDLEDCFNDIIEPGALRAEKYFHHEQLQEADSTKRMPVPVMDFSIPKPPWEAAQSSVVEEQAVKEIMLLVAKMKCHHMSVSKIERELPWSPFASQLGHIIIDEPIEDFEQVAEYMGTNDLEDAVDFENLTWKPPGLRILDQDEKDEEDLQPSSHQESPRDLEHLLEKRKRALDIQEAGVADELSILANNSSISRGSLNKSGQGPCQLRADITANTSTTDNRPGSLFSASDELDRFMRIQAGQTFKKPKLVHVTPITQTQKASSTPLSTKKLSNVDHPVLSTKIQAPTQPLPAPPISSSNTPRPIIVSSTLLHQRHHLIRHITRLLPSISLIERNPNTTYLAQVADFTISPSTALICTTLQETKQKTLPGQSTQSPIRARITACAPYSERLIVLVSAGRDDLMHDPTLDERDCAALAEVTSFCTALDHGISVVYVAGGEEELARWITGLVCAAPPPGEESVLLQDVTLWELFLTRAGMNAFAAQAVLSELKAPDREERDRETGNVYGLAAFVAMGVEERVERFEGVIGGRKVLERVGRLLSEVRVRDGAVTGG